MKDFFIAALFGAAQVSMLFVTIYFLNRGRVIFGILCAALKTAAYIRAAYLLFGRYSAHILHCVAGYIAGAPLFAFLLLLGLYLIKKYLPGARLPAVLRIKR